MIVRDTGRAFEPHPDFTGRAVCVDVTPLKRRSSAFGDRDCFRFVFETDTCRDDGSRRLIWSQPFTASLHEKSALRGFLRSWFGRDLTSLELQGLDLETLVGRAAELEVGREVGDNGQTFDRIVECSPQRQGEPFAPSGRYTRTKDRHARPPGATPSEKLEPLAPTTPEPDAPLHPENVSEAIRHGAVLVHVGRNRGKRFDQLLDADIDALAKHWLPTIVDRTTALPADRDLAAAIEYVLRIREGDDVPF